VSALAQLLREDAAAEMPPMTTWFAGGRAVASFFGSHVLTGAGRYRLVPTQANGQPAFAAYERGADGNYEAHAVFVLTLTGTQIARIVIFLDPGLVTLFGMPGELGAPAPRPARP